jgi:hypothetical protein
MAPHALDGSFHRVRRAEEHLVDLEARLAGPIGQHFEPISLKYEAQAPHTLLVEYEIGVDVAISMRIAVLIGETCYNLRCALDYFVAALAELDSGSVQTGTQFPIEDTEKGFEWRKGGSWLKGINATHVAMIEWLQPYRGCRWTAHLRELSNRDKHYKFVAVERRHVGTFYESFNDTFYRRRDLPEYSAHHPIYGEVHVKFDVATVIALKDGTPAISALHKIKGGVLDALTDCAPDFQRRRSHPPRTFCLPDPGTLLEADDEAPLIG